MPIDTAEKSSPVSASQRIPQIGEIVHYVAAGNLERPSGIHYSAAIVTNVFGPTCVNLRVFPDCGESFAKSSCSMGSLSSGANPKPTAGCWYFR